jgi:5-methylcytosine-specific restriction endonuclease McrA
MDTYTPAFSKPRRKRRVTKAKRNKVPTINDTCLYCGTPYASTHEVFEGTGRRQLSIKYELQVKLCMKCHKDIQEHPLQGRDLELKKEFQTNFEETHSREDFVKLFGRNYL